MPVALARTLLDEISDFVREKWKHSECELCGTDRWLALPDDAAYAYIPVNSEGGPAGNVPPPSSVYVQLLCSNCGNLRLVAKQVFDEWRRVRETNAET